jgi:hypothetical protein
MRVLFLISILFVCHLSLKFHSDQDVQSEFVEMAPKGWENLEQSYRELSGVLKIKNYSGTEEKESISVKFVTNRNSEIIHRDSDRDGKRYVICRNHRNQYFFVLTENSGKPKYQLQELGKFPDEMSLYKVFPDQEKIVRSLLMYIRSPWVFETYSFPQMVKENGFRIKKVAQLGNDPNLVSVNFEFDSKHPELVSSIKNGIAVFSKKHSWGLVQFSGELSWGWINSVIEYHEDISQLVVPKTITQEFWRGAPGSGELGTNFRCDVLKFEKYAASPNEFTLSSFGLPEPKGHQGGVNGIVTICVGVGLIGICILLRQILRMQR